MRVDPEAIKQICEKPKEEVTRLILNGIREGHQFLLVTEEYGIVNDVTTSFHYLEQEVGSSSKKLINDRLDWKMYDLCEMGNALKLINIDIYDLSNAEISFALNLKFNAIKDLLEDVVQAFKEIFEQLKPFMLFMVKAHNITQITNTTVQDEAELQDRLCEYCECTDYGEYEINTGPHNLCEGSRCEETIPRLKEALMENLIDTFYYENPEFERKS